MVDFHRTVSAKVQIPCSVRDAELACESVRADLLLALTVAKYVEGIGRGIERKCTIELT